MNRAIDIHHHILPPAYMTALGSRLGPQGLFGSPPQWSPAISIEAMDRNGIGAAITSISAPGVWFGDVPEACRLARECNEYAAQMKCDFPRRFGLFATLTLPDVETSLREIDYAFGALAADGVVLMTNYDGRYPGDEAFRPVFDELNRRKAIVFFHPTIGPYKNPLAHIPVPSLEFPFDTTRAIVSLLYSGTLARCRDIRFIFSHAGGAVPFLAQRIARLTARPEFKQAVPDGVLAELGRLYFDTALSANLFAFDPMRRLVPVSNILFGSDYPHAGEPTMTATLKGVDELGLKAGEIGAVRAGNATVLFPHLVAGAPT
ncbi:MAG TPA: amidohydrolase family protein [Pseudolabrys sp.]|nr:amidohydrolase family protein [Pseudolabrys sp.]